MVKPVIILIYSLIPCLLAHCTTNIAEAFLRRSIYKFSIYLLNRTAENNENFVISPFSMWTVLATLSHDAADTTQEEMMRVLKLHRHKCYNNKFLEIASMVRSYNNPDIAFTANSHIFVSDQMQILNNVKTNLSRIDSNQIERLIHAGLGVHNINNITDYGIEEKITAEDFEGALMIIGSNNFKGTWKLSFLGIKDGHFFNEEGKVVADIKFMYSVSWFNYCQIDNIKANVLELPYSIDNRYSMLIFLPYDNVAISTVIGSMEKITLTTIFHIFKRLHEQQMAVEIPRFKIESNFKNDKIILINMGLERMFDKSRAQFPFIADYPMHVAKFLQKSVYEVTEEGKIPVFETVLMPGVTQRFTANKPFLFMVVDKQVKIPIFIGTYSKPTI